MKATELRIGNLVCLTSDVGDFPEYIETIVGVMDIEHAIKQEDFFEGIPITEEWLIRFGFEKYDVMGENHFFCFSEEDKFSFNLCLRDNKIKVSFYNLDWDRAFELDYIHQLQNLYFSITGEELKLKEI